MFFNRLKIKVGISFDDLLDYPEGCSAMQNLVLLTIIKSINLNIITVLGLYYHVKGPYHDLLPQRAS